MPTPMPRRSQWVKDIDKNPKYYLKQIYLKILFGICIAVFCYIQTRNKHDNNKIIDIVIKWRNKKLGTQQTRDVHPIIVLTLARRLRCRPGINTV